MDHARESCEELENWKKDRKQEKDKKRMFILRWIKLKNNY